MGNCMDALEARYRFRTDTVFSQNIIYSEGYHVLNVKSWQASSEQLKKTSSAVFFPENKCRNLRYRADVAVGFTGGGPRGYLCAIGYLAGLRDLNLLDNIKYLGGIGGSSWAVLAFTFSQLPCDDQDLMGELVSPEELSISKLNEGRPNCMRAYAARDLAEGMEKKYIPGCKLSDVWGDLIFETYLSPVGIKPQHYFSYTDFSVSDIKLRNPCLADSQFYLPTNKKRPFPIVGASVIGPHQLLPPEDPFCTVRKESFSFFEITPLYFGNFYPQKINYDFGYGEESVMVGGAVEPIGFAKDCTPGSEPFEGLGPKKTKDFLFVPKPDEILDLKECIAMSSYASETVISPDFVMKDEGALSFNFWSCVSQKPSSIEMVVADGGYTQSIPLISFLQRRVKNIILFFESTVPLKTYKEWDVDEDAPTDDQIDKSFSSFFGIFPKSANETKEFQNNQVFSSKDFNKVIKGLQEAQQKGEPIMYHTELVTVENSFWGIPAGIRSKILFSYLGHIKVWEDQLPQETQKQLGAEEEFSEFPFFPDNFNGINTKGANLLCNITGWSIIRNKELFETIISDCETILPVC